MLLRYGASNFRSIRSYSEMSFVASKAIKDTGVDLLSVPGFSDKVLPFILCYGANASGKSTAHWIMSAIRNHVVRSFTDNEPGGGIPRSPFALEESTLQEPTRFDCDFLISGTRYHFGFSYDDEKFLEEWLYYFPEGRRRQLYIRESSTPEINFGKSLKGHNRSIERILRPNSLFLSTAAQSDHEQLLLVFDFFKNHLGGCGPTVSRETIHRDFSEGMDARILGFLKNSDTGIQGYKIEEIATSEENEEIYSKLASAIEPITMGKVNFNIKMPQNSKLRLGHRTLNGEDVYLSLESESRGTLKLLMLLKDVFNAIDTGGTLFVDEIDTSLHPLLTERLVRLFAEASSNQKQAQLMATTHNTNILCSDIVRRDQIWFAEKNASGETFLYPLTDIRTRKTDRLERGYLQGRFGAIPFGLSSPSILDTKC